MYSPKIRERYIPILYRLARAKKMPMTKLVNQIIHTYLVNQIAEDILKGGDKNEQPINSRAGLPDPSDKKVIPLSSHSQ